MAKDVLKFKAFTGKGVELPIGLIFLYLLSNCDSSIDMTNDRKTLLRANWEEV